MEKLFFYDLETTGVMHWKNGVHQISGCVVIDNEVEEYFNFNVCPHERAIIEEDALLVGGVTKEQILAYPSMREVYNQIIQILSRYVDKYNKQDKFHLVGYNNSSFDNQFFRAFFVQNNDIYFGSWFWSDTIDVMVLASNKLKGERGKLINFKQQTVAKYIGIEIDETKLHDAEYDIDICRKIYENITQ
jgi:DNA polymerase-3 subunit epsilon